MWLVSSAFQVNATIRHIILSGSPDNCILMVRVVAGVTTLTEMRLSGTSHLVLMPLGSCGSCGV